MSDNNEMQAKQNAPAENENEIIRVKKEKLAELQGFELPTDSDEELEKYLTVPPDCKNLNDSVVILSDAYTKNYIETYKDASEGYADLIPGKYSSRTDHLPGITHGNIDLAPVRKRLLCLDASLQNNADPVCIFHQMKYGFTLVIALDMMRYIF